jgi:NAD(P)H-flavin reductase
VLTATVGPQYIANTRTDLASLKSAAANGSLESTQLVALFPVVQVASPVTDYDDTDITNATMGFVWAYGDSVVSGTSPLVVALSPAQNSGSGAINFFSGSTSGEAANGVAVVNQSLHNASFASSFSVQWTVQPLSATPAKRVFQELTATYAPEELEVQITFVATADVWVAMGISPDGMMNGSEIWLGYVKQYVAPGASQPTTYVQLSDRMAIDGYVVPAVDPVSNLKLISYSTTASGYRITFSRPLIPTDPTYEYPIVNAQQSIVWAYGPFDLQTMQPLIHTQRGAVSINLISGESIGVPQRGDSLWYIMTLAGVSAGLMVLAFAARVVSPSAAMYRRPLLRVGVPAHFGGSLTIAELAVLALHTLMCGALWMYGNFTDMSYNQRQDAALLAVGAGAQFFLYFTVIPSLRNNYLLRGVFRVSFHRFQHWTRLLSGLGVGLGWVHGTAMMVKRPQESFGTSRGIAAIVGLCMLTLYALSISWSHRWAPHRVRHTARLLTLAAFVVLLSIHTPKLAIGMSPALLLFLVDVGKRWRDFNTRFGRVVASGTFVRATAFEVAVRSPWESCGTPPFTSSPGQFVLVHIVGVDDPIPLIISTRVVQHPENDVASVTFHSRDAPRGTRRQLCDLNASRALVGSMVRVEGPYGGIQLRLKWYRSLIVIGGGIGAASCVSMLEALALQPDYFARETSLESVCAVFCVRHAEELLTFAAELTAILEAPRPFDLTLFMHVTGARAGGVGVDDFSSIHCLPRPGASASKIAAPDHPLFKIVAVHPGRPLWTPFFAEQQLRAVRCGEKRVAVHVNGPRSMADDVLRTTERLSSIVFGFQFHVDVEHYGVM